MLRSAGQQRAFTLIELLLAGAVLCVLLTIVWPGYEGLLLKGRRLTAVALLQEAWARQESYKLRWGEYALDLEELGLPEPSYIAAEGLVAESGDAFYQLRLDLENDRYVGMSIDPLAVQRADPCGRLSVGLLGLVKGEPLGEHCP